MSDDAAALSLQDTRVPIFIPLAVIGALACAQLFLGTSPEVVALCALGVALPFIPLHLYGRDIYSMFGIVFAMRYAGVALIAKTAYRQPLELHLYQPAYSYFLNVLLMAAVTAVLLIARGLDRGTAMFPLPTATDLPGLRRLSIFGLIVGFGAQVIVGALSKTESGAATGGAGPLLVLSHLFASLFYLGLVCEVIYGVTKTNGRSFITPLLAFATGVTLLISIAMNWREFFATGMIAAAATAFMYRAVRLRHVLAGLVVVYFFLSFLSPITLYLRAQREGLDRSHFIALALQTFQRAATDPAFLSAVKSTERALAFQDTGDVETDYYGDRNNTLNRFSYIGLLDTISMFSQNAPPIGLNALKQAVARNAPGFLGFDKSMTIYGAGDWLSWQIGMGTYGQIGFANFGLPMEGLATWGVIGLIVYPFVFMLPVIFLISKISSLRLRLPFSIFLFVTFQHSLVEGTSDFFIGVITKDFIILSLLSAAIYYALFRQRTGAALPLGRTSMPIEPN